MFFLAHIGADDGLHIIFLLYGTQTPVMKELGTLIRLLNVLRHALKTAELVLILILLLKKKDYV